MRNPTFRQAVFFCALLLGGALAANADTIPFWTGPYPGGIAAGWTTGFSLTAHINRSMNYRPGFDRLQLYIDSLTGVAAGSQIKSMEGTWSISYITFDLGSQDAVNSYNAEYATSFTWADFASSSMGPTGASTLDGFGQTPTSGPLSYINLPANGSARWSRIGSGQAFTSFTGGWFTSGTGLSDGSLLGVLIVPHDFGFFPYLKFDGVLGFTYNGGATQNAELLARPLEPRPGDVNGDGVIDINDLTIVLAYYNQPGSRPTGDANYDGKVDINDLTIVLTNYTGTGSSGLATVPDPSAFALLGSGAVVFLSYAWRRRRFRL
jgi:hypothetical protein